MLSEDLGLCDCVTLGLDVEIFRTSFFVLRSSVLGPRSSKSISLQ